MKKYLGKVKSFFFPPTDTPLSRRILPYAVLGVLTLAVFIGGTSIFGGQGTIVGTFFGSFIVGSIEAGIVATGMQGFYTRVVVGLVLLVAISFHIFMEKPNETVRRFRFY